MSRCLYFGFTDSNKIEIVRYLKNQYNWLAVYITGFRNSEAEPNITIEFPDAVVEDTFKLRIFEFDYEKLGEKVPVDSNILQKIAMPMNNCIGFMQDTNKHNCSFYERKRQFFDILTYWNTVLLATKPDNIIFFTWPHTTVCYPLYLLSKHIYKKKVLYIHPIPLLENERHFISNSLESQHESFMETYDSDESHEFNPVVINYLEQIRGMKPEIPAYINSVYEKNKDESTQVRLMRFFSRLSSNFQKKKQFPEISLEYKKNTKYYLDKSCRLSLKELSSFRKKINAQNKELKKYYDSRCITPDITELYIYFAAPYQPEAVSSINGGYYEDVILVLELIRSVLPDGWKIYYKEHPAIFINNFTGSLSRDSSFYEHVKNIGCVEYVRSDFNTFALVDSSRAVATISGTAGWEAVVRGKPSIAFGHSWYQGCKSIHTVTSLCELKSAMLDIQDGKIPDANDVNKYAQAVFSNTITDIFHHQFKKKISGRSDSVEIMQRIAEAYHSACTKYYG